MCKSYKKSKTDYEKRISVLAPVNPQMIDPLESPEQVLMVNGVDKPVKDCPICYKYFTSEHAYQIHIRKHRPVCPYCGLKLKSWSEYSEHIPHCRGKYHVRRLPRTTRVYRVKKPVFKYKCQLCKRRYINEKQLQSHQICRCGKRYMKNGWVVKI